MLENGGGRGLSICGRAQVFQQMPVVGSSQHYTVSGTVSDTTPDTCLTPGPLFLLRRAQISQQMAVIRPAGGDTVDFARAAQRVAHPSCDEFMIEAPLVNEKLI